MRVLIVASAPCVWVDLTAVAGERFDVVIATSYMMRDCTRPIDYQCTLHVRDFLEMPVRHSAHVPYKKEAKRVSVENIDVSDIVYDQVPFRNGSSGLYCVGFALLIGGDDITLAGSPLSGADHYYGGPVPFKFNAYRPAWEVALPQMLGKVRSLSGWTKELLGD